ncbi:MAG TPA: serine hydrolase domain-containing protein, partial [Kofleriaceae bacterium]|nr:serine hydrolase domain-containing protein [Kofleriaceae bacterium]
MCRILPLALVALVACSGSPQRHVAPVRPAADVDPDGPHRDAVAAQVKPFIDSEIAQGIVIGLYDAGKLEIYGFGDGPGHKPPTGRTLFEIGSITKAYTSLLLADAAQARAVELDEPLADLLPPGITAPTRDDKAITLRQLSTHMSGLPGAPPSIAPNGSDPYGRYSEDQLYADLVRTPLAATPGTMVEFSNFGSGVLGFVLGKKLGRGFAAELKARVLDPLGLHDTYLSVPPAAEPRRASGTNDDLKPAGAWTWGALAGAGALISTARDQLALIDAELDAAAGAKGPLRDAMRLTQERQLDHAGENEGLGWQIDVHGRFWHNGGTGGFRSFVGFDPQTKRGVVILSSTSVTLVDHLNEAMYGVLDNNP